MKGLEKHPKLLEHGLNKKIPQVLFRVQNVNQRAYNKSIRMATQGIN